MKNRYFLIFCTLSFIVINKTFAQSSIQKNGIKLEATMNSSSYSFKYSAKLTNTNKETMIVKNPNAEFYMYKKAANPKYSKSLRPNLGFSDYFIMPPLATIEVDSTNQLKSGLFGDNPITESKVVKVTIDDAFSVNEVNSITPEKTQNLDSNFRCVYNDGKLKVHVRCLPHENKGSESGNNIHLNYNFYIRFENIGTEKINFKDYELLGKEFRVFANDYKKPMIADYTFGDWGEWNRFHYNKIKPGEAYEGSFFCVYTLKPTQFKFSLKYGNTGGDGSIYEKK